MTPINVKMLENYLEKTGYDANKKNWLINGFVNGFDIGYRGSYNRQDTSNNLPFRTGTPVDMWNKLMKEVKAGRVAGPYDELPFDQYIQSPLGLVPKAAGTKTRLIFHLPYDFGPAENQRSVNHLTLPELCSLKYNDLDHAVRNCLHLIREITRISANAKLLKKNPSYFLARQIVPMRSG